MRMILWLLLVALSTYKSNAQPVDLEWFSTSGSSGDEQNPIVTTDVFGNVYHAGCFYDSLNLTGASFNSYSNGDRDIFIAKYSESGVLLWHKTIGGIGMDFALDIHTDDSGNVYLGGTFQNIVDFDPDTGVFNKSSNGSSDLYVLKLTPNGALIWAYTAGGIDYDTLSRIDLGDNNSVYVVGDFRNAIDFDPTLGSASLTSSVKSNYVLKLSSTGSFIWVKGLISNSSCSITGLMCSPDTTILISGFFSGTIDLDPGSGILNSTASGLFDSYIVKLNPNGGLIWEKILGASESEVSRSIVVDSQGGIYVSGSFSLFTDLDPGVNDSIVYANGSGDIFLVKLSGDGNFLWGRSFGGAFNDLAVDLAIDAYDRVYLTGTFTGGDLDPGPNNLNYLSAGGSDFFLQQYNSNGTLIWAFGNGGVGADMGTDIAFGANGDLYLSGSFSDTFDINLGLPSQIVMSSGLKDNFLLKFNQCTNTIDAGITPLDLTLTSNQTTGTYQWIDCSTYLPINGEVNQSFLPSANGSYAVVITLGNCIDTSDCFVISNVGIEENQYQAILVYSNPTEGIVNVEIKDLQGSASIKLIDALGSIIYIENTTSQISSFNISDRQPGVYFVVVNAPQGDSVKRIIKF